MLKKLINVLSIISIISIVFLFNFVHATNINMNLTNPNARSDAQTTASTSNSIENNNEQANYAINLDNDADSIPEPYSSESSTVGTLSSLPEASLGLTNVLSIILIVIGVLLVLLAIAILIRLAH